MNTRPPSEAEPPLSPPCPAAGGRSGGGRRLLVAGLCVAALVPLVWVAAWLVFLATFSFSDGTGNGPWGSATAPEEDLPHWDGRRVDEYERRLGQIAAWVRATFPRPGVHPDLTLPPALSRRVTHGPVEAAVRADGQVILLVQFYDFNLSTDSEGVVFATSPFRPEQVGKTRDGSPTIADPELWKNSLTRQVRPNLYLADIDEVPQAAGE